MTFTIPNATIAARFKVAAVDLSNNPLGFSAGTAEISDSTKAYIAQATDGQIYVQPNSTTYPGPGLSTNLTVKINGVNTNGVPIEELTINIVLQGPPAPPAAVAFAVVSGPEFNDSFPVPANPGTAIITIV